MNRNRRNNATTNDRNPSETTTVKQFSSLRQHEEQQPAEINVLINNHDIPIMTTGSGIVTMNENKNKIIDAV